MTETVDKVARALWEASPPVLRATDSAVMAMWPNEWAAVDAPTKSEFVALARAALEAMREPTDRRSPKGNDAD